MRIYDYKEEITSCITDYISNYVDFSDYTTINELVSHLRALRDEDQFTGNHSGSFTFNRHTAGEYLIGNFDLLEEALAYFGEEFSGSEEICDVLIRLYLFDDCVDFAIAEIESEYNEFWEELDDEKIHEYITNLDCWYSVYPNGDGYYTVYWHTVIDRNVGITSRCPYSGNGFIRIGLFETLDNAINKLRECVGDKRAAILYRRRSENPNSELYWEIEPCEILWEEAATAK